MFQFRKAMGGKQISDLTVRIGADTLGFTSGMKKAKEESDMFAKGFSALKGAVAGAFAVGSVLAFGSAAAQAYDKQAQAENLLLVAVRGRTDVQQRLLQQASALEKITGIPDAEIANQQKYLSSLGMQEAQVKRVTAASIQLSAATGMGLDEAVKNLAKTYGGLTGELGESIPGLKALTVEQLKNGEAVAYIEKNYKGFAEVASQTGLGPLKQLDNAYTNLEESVGSLVTSAINPFVSSLRDSVQGVADYLKVPYSEKLQDEQAELIVLVSSIQSVNEKSDERKNLMTELVAKYPTFLEGLDKETVSNKQLGEQLKIVTALYEKKINAAIISEEIGRAEAALTEKLTSQREAIKLVNKAYAELAAQGKVSGNDVLLKDKATEVYKNIGYIDAFKIAIRSLWEGKTISDWWKEMNSFDTSAEVMEIQRLQKELAALGVEEEQVSKKDGPVNDDKKKKIIAAAGSLAFYREQLTKVKEEIDKFPEAQKNLFEFGNLKAKAVDLEKVIGLLEAYENRTREGNYTKVKSKGTKLLHIDNPTIKIEGVETYQRDLKNTVNITEGATSVISSSFSDLAVGIGESFGAMATGTNGMESLVYSVLGAFAGFIRKFGEMMVTTAIAGMALSKAMRNLFNPASWGVALGAGILLIAAGTAMQSSMTKATSPTPKLAKGGIAFGPTLALVGDNPNARTDPEVIAPLSKLKTLGGGGGEVRLVGNFRVQGQDLVYVLEKANQQRKIPRG